MFRFAWCRRSTFAFVLLSLLAPSAGLAQSGSTLTPDRMSYLVSKDVGSERWTINLNLATLAPPRTVNVTGNVFRGPGTPPSFIWCQEREDSTGTLDDPSSVFRLRCSGAGACDGTATGCAQTDWVTIADPVEIEASFFLPDAGNGAFLRDPVGGVPVTARIAGPPVASLGTAALVRGDTPAGGAPARGASLPPDGSNFLVNKDLGGLRYSISLNRIPAQRGNARVQSCPEGVDCVISNRLLNATGNVYPADGSAPQFIWCQERQDSTGSLDDPQSTFRFGCLGTSPCERTATECAQQDWALIPGGDDVQIPASFFLPPGGLPATPQSDPEIVVIGRTSDPPSVVVPLGQGASAPDTATVAGGCGPDACTVSIGSCPAVTGRTVFDPSLGCSCLVDEVPPDCIACGVGASGTCGGDCSYPVGGGTARGECLPFSSTRSDCACYAANQDDTVAISMCGGALGTDCPSGKCCTDDLRDGCDPAAGDLDCPGICVDSNGCDPTVSQCGSCFPPADSSQLFCGTLAAPDGASCCEDCPDGSINCFCQPGRVCNLESEGGGCCPTSRPDLCNGTLCIPSGADCCVDCPEGADSCFCAAGSLCILESEGGGCCPPGATVSCGNSCLPDGADCCSAEEGTFCNPGFLCTAGTRCVPAEGDDCGDGFFCEAGFQCVDESPGCCRADLACDETCLTDGEDCCGDGFFCEVGSVCVGQGAEAGCCPADLPVGCGDGCLPPGSQCCSDEDGTFCDPGFACEPPDQCVPVDGASAAALQRRSGGGAPASPARVTTAASASTAESGATPMVPDAARARIPAPAR